MRVLAAALVGFAVGFGVSAPPTGPVALLALRYTLVGQPRRAVLFGFGAALADVPYALLGALGYGWLIADHPAVGAAFDAFAAVLLVAVGVRLLQALSDEPQSGGGDVDAGTGMRAVGAVLHGLGLGLANATRLVTWTVAASILGPTLPGGLGAGALGATVAYAVAVGAGELGWIVAQVAGWRWCAARAPAGLHRLLLLASAALAFALSGGVAVRAARVAADTLSCGGG
jgi:threonine/homoserine/homoserine lactone efflux protein